MANSEGLNSALEELNSLIGLESVKSDIQSMINLVRMNQMRKEKGQTVPNISLHMVFTGNPGTGKTVVARLLATIYKEIGVLSKGQLIETARQDLVAQYIGHTALKTKQVIDSAKGGILFIDEAYTLYKKGSGNDFGQEAIDTLLKEMEDNRGDLIVIVAGHECASKDCRISINSFLIDEATETTQYTDPIALNPTDTVTGVVCTIKGIQYDDGQYFNYTNTSYAWIIDATENSTSNASSPANVTEEPTKASTAEPTKKVSELEPLNMKNGQIVIEPDYNCLCTLEIKTASVDNYYVYLDYIGAPSDSYNQRSLRKNASKPYEDDMAFFVKAGHTVQVEVPIGVYELYYATGKDFYGRDEKFGDDTSYCKADATFDFYTTKTQTSGYTVTLYTVDNGNMDTDPISESQFPG